MLDGVHVHVRFQEVHGAIELVQFQVLRPFDMRVLLELLLMAVEFRGRSTGTISDQGKQQALDIKSKLPRAGLLSNHGVDAQLPPDGFEDVEAQIRRQSPPAPTISEVVSRIQAARQMESLFH